MSQEGGWCFVKKGFDANRHHREEQQHAGPHWAPQCKGLAQRWTNSPTLNTIRRKERPNRGWGWEFGGGAGGFQPTADKVGRLGCPPRPAVARAVLWAWPFLRQMAPHPLRGVGGSGRVVSSPAAGWALAPSKSRQAALFPRPCDPLPIALHW